MYGDIASHLSIKRNRFLLFMGNRIYRHERALGDSGKCRRSVNVFVVVKMEIMVDVSQWNSK